MPFTASSSFCFGQNKERDGSKPGLVWEVGINSNYIYGLFLWEFKKPHASNLSTYIQINPNRTDTYSDLRLYLCIIE